ncbi:MAG: DUF3179 domain-containing protein [Gammaproteobacteria bacterium]|nr:DUF3179 domain-containing protein [Gammaproteobacteria bacterium]
MNTRTIIQPCCIVLSLLLITEVASAEQKNGFAVDHGLIDAEDIVRGGPAKDGIPAIDKPEFIDADNANFLKDSDHILGIEIDGIAKAYPVSILNWHEIVNDAIEKTAYTVSYCPLCGTGIAFDRDVDGKIHSFGVSGLLYNSDVLMYDRETESLWSQIMGKAVTGRYKGTALHPIPIRHTTWSNWKQLYPTTQVLSTDTGYSRQYGRDPYEAYQHASQTYFPVTHKAPGRYHPKERVLGITDGHSQKAYPFIELNKNNSHRFSDHFGGKTYIIYWNRDEQSGYLTDEKGAIMPAIQAYWFAWYAFHPDTTVFTAGTDK